MPGLVQGILAAPGQNSGFDPARKGNRAVLGSGNTTLTVLGASGNSAAALVTPMSSGKLYAEFTVGAVIGADVQVGLINSSATAAGELNSGVTLGNTANGWAYISGALNGRRHSASTGAYGVSCSPGDVLGIAFDMTNFFLYVAKNNVWMNSGNPTSGASGTGNMFGSGSGLVAGTYYFAADVWGAGSISISTTYTPPMGYTRVL